MKLLTTNNNKKPLHLAFCLLSVHVHSFWPAQFKNHGKPQGAALCGVRTNFSWPTFLWDLGPWIPGSFRRPILHFAPQLCELLVARLTALPPSLVQDWENAPGEKQHEAYSSHYSKLVFSLRSWSLQSWLLSEPLILSNNCFAPFPAFLVAVNGTIRLL